MRDDIPSEQTEWGDAGNRLVYHACWRWDDEILVNGWRPMPERATTGAVGGTCSGLKQTAGAKGEMLGRMMARKCGEREC